MSSTKHKIVLEVPEAAVSMLLKLTEAIDIIDKSSNGQAVYAAAVAATNPHAPNPVLAVAGILSHTPVITNTVKHALCGSLDATVESWFATGACEHAVCRTAAQVVRGTARARGLELVFEAEASRDPKGCSKGATE